MKNYYTTIQASKLLGVSVRTVQLWVENGSLEAWKTAGGHRRITASSVDEYVEQRLNTATQPTDENYILIVEDNPTVSKFYEAAIRSWGLDVKVKSTQDGFEALVEIGKRKPELLITDIYMPGMDGLQMIRSLYKSDLISADRIIVISGLSDENISERVGIPDGIDFFTKPVDVAEFKSSILKKLRLNKNQSTVEL